MVRIKRVYDSPEVSDGFRVLVDRLWPRGLKKEAAHIDLWLRDVAPSDELRKWYGHEPARWEEFRRCFKSELSDPAKLALLAQLEKEARRGTVTLLFATKELAHNNAVVIRDVLSDHPAA